MGMMEDLFIKLDVLLAGAVIGGREGLTETNVYKFLVWYSFNRTELDALLKRCRDGQNTKAALLTRAP